MYVCVWDRWEGVWGKDLIGTCGLEHYGRQEKRVMKILGSEIAKLRLWELGTEVENTALPQYCPNSIEGPPRGRKSGKWE